MANTHASKHLQDPASTRLIVCESELDFYCAAYPALSRQAVLDTMIRERPDRSRVERALAQLAAGAKP